MYQFRIRFAITSLLLTILLSIVLANPVFGNNFLAGMAPTKPNQYQLFTIQGSNTVGAQLGPELVKAYFLHLGATHIKEIEGDETNEKSIQGRLTLNGVRSTIEVQVAAHGSSTGFKALLNGKADIAASSRPIKKKEEIELIHNGNMRDVANEHIVAIDGLAIIVNPFNAVETLSTQQLQDIFTGKITRWSQLGGPNKKIRVLARNNNSGTYDTFKGLVLKKRPLIKSAQRYESNDDISSQVQQDISAIGFVALASIGNAKSVEISDGEAIPLKPSSLTVATEDYPLSRRLYLYAKAQQHRNEAINRFLTFVKSDAGQAIVDKVGFVAQSLHPLNVEASDWRRLNMNFRFQGGSSKLDNKATIDVERLVEFINRPENQTMQIKLVGYSNPDAKTPTTSISRLRAQSVRWALRSKGLSNKVKTVAGNALSVADPDSIHANKNRRVEVWVQ
ncbi:MAG: substrate-binding domain-containing protein [Pseudomonadales bacterium]|nr:substrate-binding domain-containing protein [Pseudomonadales bacterium]